MQKPEEYVQSTTLMTIKFGGSNQINTHLFTEFVDNATFILDESLQSICAGAQMKLNISAIRPGSFVFDLQAIVDATPLIVSAATVASLTAGTFLSILKIKKLLRGEKPDSLTEIGDKIVIKRNNGEITVNKSIYNIYIKPEVNVKISNIFYDLSEDGTKESFQVTHGDEGIDIVSSEFHLLSTPESFEKDEELNESFLSETQLKIRKVVLEGRAKWSFYNGTRVIDATMSDKEFLRRVKSSQIGFSCGDRLRVTLQTEYSVDECGFPIKDSEKFAILKVHEVTKFKLPEERQIKMFE